MTSSSGLFKAALVTVLLLTAGPALAQGVNPGTQAGPNFATLAPFGEEATPLDPEVLQHIELLLSGYEYFPTADDLMAVTPDPVPYLLQMAYDPEGRWLPTHHHRAVGALALFPSDVVRVHLEYMLTSTDTPELMRHHVINAMANGFGDSALVDLEPYLYADDLQLRLTAVAAISAISTPTSSQVLQSALPVEVDSLVRERIENALTAPPPTQGDLQ